MYAHISQTMHPYNRAWFQTRPIVRHLNIITQNFFSSLTQSVTDINSKSDNLKDPTQYRPVTCLYFLFFATSLLNFFNFFGQIY